MGKNKRFIAKGEGSHFHLMHRSTTDKAHGNEETPSNYVLVLSDRNKNGMSSTTQNFQFHHGDVSIGETNIKETNGKSSGKNGGIDHVNELGFHNDGYDYTQHLKVMGGGKFISKDGTVRLLEIPNESSSFSISAKNVSNTSSIPSSEILPTDNKSHFHSTSDGMMLELPDDVIPSGLEFERDLRAITISHEVMDDDMQAALFGEDDEFDTFEELQDDFVLEVMQEPEIPDFDFDAHIAMLIKRSERMALGISDGKNEEDEDEVFSEMDGDDHTLTTETRNRYGKYKHVSHEQQAIIDAEFENTLLEYDDEEIGDIEHAFYDPEGVIDGSDVYGSDGLGIGDVETIRTVETRGGIDFDSEVLNNALDDFIQSEKDCLLVDGVTVKKGQRSIAALYTANMADSLEPDFHKEYVEQVAEQEQFQLLLNVARDEHKEIESCQAYLREEVVREDWDCESILSTYSTLDNHPSLIKTPSVKASKSVASESGSLATSYQSWITEGGRSYKGKVRPEKVYEKAKTYTMPALTGASQTAKIMLTGKLQLPVGFQTGKPVNRVSRQIACIEELSKMSVLANNMAKMSVHGNNGTNSSTNIQEIDKEIEVIDEEEEECDESGSDDDDEVEFETREKAIKVKETPEEKKLRKLAVKEGKRERRTLKKQMKTAFKSEYLTQVTSKARAQDIDSVRVFKYTL